MIRSSRRWTAAEEAELIRRVLVGESDAAISAALQRPLSAVQFKRKTKTGIRLTLKNNSRRRDGSLSVFDAFHDDVDRLARIAKYESRAAARLPLFD